MSYKKKLIEVALPLEAINKASAREKSIRHGHPSTLHLWWARRPLAAARAVIFAQMVDDPSEHPDLFPTEKAQAKERKRLFDIIEELVQWENTNNEEVLQKARDAIWQSWRRTCAENADHPRAEELFDRHKLPGFHDPFAGGGSLPLEAQRLGLEAYASDLNPVAVLINKAMIEIPPKFAGQPPVNPPAREEKGLFEKKWHGVEAMADDVHYYGQWIRNEARRKIGHLYPKAAVTSAMVADRPDLAKYEGQELTVIAWLWARTVKSPNPAFAHVDVPLVSNFILATKPGSEFYLEAVVNGDDYNFAVRKGRPDDISSAENGTKLGRGANFKCILSDTPIPSEHLYAEAQAGRMGARLLAIVADGARERIYLPPDPWHEKIAGSASPEWVPDSELPANPRWFSPPLYGLTTYGHLFTRRQLVALDTFSRLVQDAPSKIRSDIQQLLEGQSGEIDSRGYGEAVALYLALAVDKLADYNSTIVLWSPGRDQAKSTFARQALPMTWDYAEVNCFAEAAGDLQTSVAGICKALSGFPRHAIPGASFQDSAQTQNRSIGRVVSTDPPYFDNIGYADLSDFFYTWLRRSVRGAYSDLFSTLTVPKAEELVATPYRHGGKKAAERFFLNGMTLAIKRLAHQAHEGLPLTIYYAFKQSESKADDRTSASTGWEVFLDALIGSGLSVRGTWPIRTERGARSIGIGTNALASSIVLVCRQRPANAPSVTRREFLSALRSELPQALLHLQRSNIAPVDLAQAAIGPGMAVYTRYSKVIDSEGNSLAVREALSLINETLDETFAEQEGDFDADSRWALAWFEQSGFGEGDYGVAETLSKAKNTSIKGLEDSGMLLAKAGKVRLLKPEELAKEWDPVTDTRLSVWEMVHHLVRVLEGSGESPAADLVKKLGTKAEVARELCYRLYTICERKKRANEARSYNNLVQSWPEITRLAREAQAEPQQGDLFEEVSTEKVG